MYKAYLWLIRFFYACVFKSGIDVLWSKVYRWLFERDYKNKPLIKFTTYREIFAFIKQQVWIADGVKELWNAYSYPAYFQVTGQNRSIAHDCDEFALYQATVIENAVKDGTFEEKDITTGMLTVMWVNKDWKQAGHNVCLIQSKDGFKWVDYQMPSQVFKTLEEVVASVISVYSPEADVSSIAIRNTDLSTRMVIWP